MIRIINTWVLDIKLSNKNVKMSNVAVEVKVTTPG